MVRPKRSIKKDARKPSAMYRHRLIRKLRLDARRVFRGDDRRRGRRHRAQRREDEYNQKAGHGGLSDGPFVGLRLAVDKF